MAGAHTTVHIAGILALWADILRLDVGAREAVFGEQLGEAALQAEVFRLERFQRGAHVRAAQHSLCRLTCGGGDAPADVLRLWADGVKIVEPLLRAANRLAVAPVQLVFSFHIDLSRISHGQTVSFSQ